MNHTICLPRDNWLARVQPRAPRTLGPRCRSGSGHSSLATWGGWPGLIGELEGCRTISAGCFRSDLIVCGPRVAPMWPSCLERGPRPRRRGHSSPWVRPNISRFQVFWVAPRRCRPIPGLLCHQPRPGATLVWAASWRTADLRWNPAYSSLAGRRPMPGGHRATPGSGHRQRPDPGSTIIPITKVVRTELPAP
jgi:hypothetical protein